MAAKKKPSPAFEFAKAYLTKRPAATFADVQSAAKKKRLKVIPVVYGRAKKLLGLAKPSKPKAKAKAKTTARRVVAKTGARRGRPPKSAMSGTALGTLESAISAMRKNDAERERFRKALEKIRDLAADALS